MLAEDFDHVERTYDPSGVAVICSLYKSFLNL